MLSYAVLGRNLAVVQYLVGLWVDIEARDKVYVVVIRGDYHYSCIYGVQYHYTALPNAVIHNMFEILQYLVDHGANLKAVGEDKKTALLLAMETGHETVLKYQLDLSIYTL